MPYPKQQGRGCGGTIHEQGDRVTLNGIIGTIIQFGGGSHQHVAIKDDAGYTHNGSTCDLEQEKK